MDQDTILTTLDMTRECILDGTHVQIYKDYTHTRLLFYIFLHIHAVIQSTNYVAPAQCMKSCSFRSRASVLGGGKVCVWNCAMIVGTRSVGSLISNTADLMGTVSQIYKNNNIN